LVLSFIRELKQVWNRQQENWKTVVTRQIFNRFFNQMTAQYSNIYLRSLGASPVELGAVNSASGIGSTLISLPLGHLQDNYSIRKIYLIGVAILSLSPLFYALATSWEYIAVAILISGLCMRLGSCVIICDLSLKNEDRATGKALCEGVGALPTLLAPSLAALLVTYFGGMNTEGIRPLFWIQFIVSLILFSFVALRLKEIPRVKKGTEKKGIIEGFREVFQRGTATKRWLIFLSLNMFTSGMMTPYR